MNPRIDAFIHATTIAVVGVSRRKGFANAAMQALRERGYRVLPVNAGADEVHGERCWRSVTAIPEKVGAVLVVVPPEQARDVVAECAHLGIRNVWLQQGAESDEAIQLAEEQGIALVHHACILMYAQPHGIHRLHRWLHDWRGRRA
jgi:predicted CoA-binding protein